MTTSMTKAHQIDGESGTIKSFRLIESPGHRPGRVNPLVDQMMFESVWCYKNQENITFRAMSSELGPAYNQVLEDRVKAHINLGRWLSTGIWMP